jgi:hypothetical protein
MPQLHYSSGFRKIGQPNNLKVFESNKIKGAKQDGKNRLNSPMASGGEH